MKIMEFVGSMKGKHKLVGNVEYVVLYKIARMALQDIVPVNEGPKILTIKYLFLKLIFNGETTKSVLHNDMKDRYIADKNENTREITNIIKQEKLDLHSVSFTAKFSLKIKSASSSTAR